MAENIGTVEPRYYVPRLQRFHPYNVQIPKSRISVMHYILYRCNDCNKLPLELNYRSLFLTYKINYGSLFYHYKKTTVIAKKLW